MYSVNQHWDRLKVCAVGKSYPPELFKYVTNSRARKVLERITNETEEDFQTLIKFLEKFDIKVLRPNIDNNFEKYFVNGKYIKPPLNIRDFTAMVGNKFYIDPVMDFYDDIINYVKKTNEVILNQNINSATMTRIGKDLYFGTEELKDTIFDNIDNLSRKKIKIADIRRKYKQDSINYLENCKKLFPNYRVHQVNTEGHTDGCFCPVAPNLIISIRDIKNYKLTFPNWEVVYVDLENLEQFNNFYKLKRKNHGKWWVPGEELNDDFTEIVENWLNHWVGFVNETVFDVNLLIIDQKNVVCNSYNKKVFDTFEKYGITPHIVNFRHRFFWDSGLHCITTDISRDGELQDYFPERGNESIIV